MTALRCACHRLTAAGFRVRCAACGDDTLTESVESESAS